MVRWVMVLALGAQALSAQATSNVRGIVVDPADSGLPGTAIQVRNTSTDAIASGTSQRDGTFRLDDLAPGVYELTITPPYGLQPFQAKDLAVRAGESRDLGRVRFALAVLTTAVQVSAVAPPVQAATSLGSSPPETLTMAGFRGPVSLWIPQCDLFPGFVMVFDSSGALLKVPGAKPPETVPVQPAASRKQL